MKLVEFSRGFPGMPKGNRGEPVFVNPAYVTSVVSHMNEPGMCFINLAGAPSELVLGSADAVAERLASGGVEQLPSADTDYRPLDLRRQFRGPGANNWVV